jgi:DNA transposition AAA+ family ATPase
LEERLIGKTNTYGKVKVVTSAYPGLGKTYQISNYIKNDNRAAVFFPISGRTSAESLYRRLKAKIEAN